jgi:hypothetical protein
MEPNDAGAAISAALDQIETAANDAVDTVMDLAPAWEAVSGMEGVSTLEAIATKAELEALVTAFRADIYAFHSNAYQRAVAVGIDGIFPQPRSGGR